MDRTTVNALKTVGTPRLLRLPWSRTRAAPLTATEIQSRYLTAVLNYVAARVGEGPEAEDVAAEVFTATFAALHRCPLPVPEGSAEDPVRAYLFGIARRKVADVLRRRTRRRTQPLDDVDWPVGQEQGPEARYLRSEAAQVLQEMLQRLPEDQREAVRLKYIEGLSLVEIGTILRRSPAAIGTLLHRARTTLREQGRGYFGEETDE
jgi:RNA polymerase sigma-70 factor (ECF subfamily)